MRSVTSTTLRSINYGAVLQSYALHKTQCKLCIDNLVLDSPRKTSLYYSIDFKLNKLGLIKIFSNFLYYIHKTRTIRCLDRFNSFVNENIRTTRVYNNIEDLRLDPPQANFYINGSDQVFGIRGEYDSERMLQFGSGSINRYSYAASLGEYDWNDKEKRYFSNLLKSFSKISVREKYAKEYLESFTNVICEVHVDPVFLLLKDEWDNIAAKRIINEEYILCYPLIGSSDTQIVLDELKKKTGLKTVCVQVFPIKRVKADTFIFDAGPKEFLSLFKHAKYTVTTSFHGTAFSLIYEKPFYTIIKNYKSQRMTDLLNSVGLYSRIYKKGMTVSDSVIDFTKCREKLSYERERSFDYFKRIIEEVTSTKMEQ